MAITAATLHLLLAAFALDFVYTQITHVQPIRSIRCPQNVDLICNIILTVTEMQTLNAYRVIDGTDKRDTFTSYPVTVNEQGGFDFVYGTPNNVTRLFQPIVADGTTRRNLFIVNDQLPGPTIIGYKNQRVRIKVINDLGKEAITLHWHGQHVNGTRGQQYMDGVPFVTQCPIQPGNSFVYDFNFYPAGTYWYHSHQYDERSNGMYGALIVLDPDSDDTGIIDRPEEHTIAFFEWFPVNADEWIEAPYPLPDLRFLDGDNFKSCFLSSNKTYSPINTVDGSSSGGGGPPFYAGLMNSVGWRYTQNANDCRRVANTILPFFNVTRGRKYRFRLVGSQVDFGYRFSIHNHHLRVVATDGIDAVIPNSIAEYVDYIIIHVGERYDFVLDANQPVDNYLMIAETLEDPRLLEENNYCLKAHRVYGVLHYDGASDTLPDNFDDSYDPLTRCMSTQCFALNCPFGSYPKSFNTTCVSVVNLTLRNPEPVPNNNVNPSAFLNFGFQSFHRFFGASINGVQFQIPPSPLLSQENDIPSNLFCDAPNTFTPPPGMIGTCIHTYNVETDTVEMVYTNLYFDDSTTLHPVHLHGHHFFVLNIGYPTYNEDGTIRSNNSDIGCENPDCSTGVSWTNGPPDATCNYTQSCVLKDTVLVPAGGYVRIRFPRFNWGWWIIHCHLEQHLLGGMALVVNETSAPGYAPVPEGFPTCGNFRALTTSHESALEILELKEEFRDATIALGVISSLLLIAVICLTIALIVVCVVKENSGNSSGGGGSRKIEVKLK